MTAAEKRLKFYIEWQRSLTPEEGSTYIGKWIFERILYLREAIEPDSIKKAFQEFERVIGNYR